MASRTTSAISMEARQVDELPRGKGWQYEPKWDGFRCLAVREGDQVQLTARSGKSLTRYFPDVAERLAELKPRRFVLDGELIVPVGACLSFEALQLRLHPSANRVRKLATETPALLMAFDLLRTTVGDDLTTRPLGERRPALEDFFSKLGDAGPLRLSPVTHSFSVAKRWLAKAGAGALDGVIAKRLDEPYRAGERAMLKIKHLRTADCVVGGFRYGTGSRLVGSLLLGLYSGEQLDHVGFTSGFADIDRESLTRKLEALRGAPGFTGQAPGGPSRWATERSSAWEPVKPKLVVEVQYDHVTDRRFRHGTKFVRWRPDKPPRTCTFDQIKAEAAPLQLTKMLAT